MYGKDRVDFISKYKIDRVDQYEDGAKILTTTRIINATPNSFKHNTMNIFSENLIRSMDSDLEDFVAYVISSKYKSNIFECKIIDKEKQDRLESLILNYQSKIVLKN